MKFGLEIDFLPGPGVYFRMSISILKELEVFYNALSK